MVDAITENIQEGLMNKNLHLNDLILMSIIKKNLREKFLKWTEAFERKELKVTLKKPK